MLNFFICADDELPIDYSSLMLYYKGGQTFLSYDRLVIFINLLAR